MTRRITILLLLITSAAHAEFATAKGKAYHQFRNCIALRHGDTTTITEAEAIKRGLHKCGICWRWKKGEK
jgi:hypothetical protein